MDFQIVSNFSLFQVILPKKKKKKPLFTALHNQYSERERDGDKRLINVFLGYVTTPCQRGAEKNLD